MSIDVRNDLAAGKLEELLQTLEIGIKSRFPVVKRLFTEVQSAAPAPQDGSV